jgi:PAS domain S-box-containing protein
MASKVYIMASGTQSAQPWDASGSGGGSPAAIARAGVETLARRLLDTATEAAVLRRADRVVAVNDRMLALCGRSASELLGLTLPDLAWPEDRDKALEQVACQSRGEIAEPCEFRMAHREGGFLWVRLGTALLEASGDAIAVDFFTNIDTSKRLTHAVETIGYGAASLMGPEYVRQLVCEITRLLSVRYAFAARICLHNPTRADTVAIAADGRLIDNRTFDLKGTPSGSVTGASPRLYPEGLRRLFPEDRALEEMKAESFVGFPLFSSSHVLIGLLAAMHDKPMRETEFMKALLAMAASRVAAELEREQIREEHEQHVREFESVLYVASHDFRSPLVSIMGFAHELEKAVFQLQGLVDGLTIPPETRSDIERLLRDRIPRSLHYIQAGGTKMDALISGLLRLSRAGRGILNVVSVDMNTLIHGVFETMRREPDGPSAQLEAEDLPRCFGDCGLLVQVFHALVDNALKYRRPEATPVVRVTGRIEFGEAIYCVSDNGLGIAAEHLRKIWELFWRWTPSSPVPGEGIGLALVQKIIDRLHGRVWVESEPRKGCRFYVALAADRQ